MIALNKTFGRKMHNLTCIILQKFVNIVQTLLISDNSTWDCVILCCYHKGAIINLLDSLIDQLSHPIPDACAIFQCGSVNLPLI